MPVCVSKHMSDIVELKNSICTDESTSDSVARLKLRRVTSFSTCSAMHLLMCSSTLQAMLNKFKSLLLRHCINVKLHQAIVIPRLQIIRELAVFAGRCHANYRMSISAIGRIPVRDLQAGVRAVHSAGLPQLLARKWLLAKPDTPIIRTRMLLPHSDFDIVADDLLHPHCGGNKLRKLDALLPELQASGCTDVARLCAVLVRAARSQVPGPMEV